MIVVVLFRIVKIVSTGGATGGSDVGTFEACAGENSERSLVHDVGESLDRVRLLALIQVQFWGWSTDWFVLRFAGCFKSDRNSNDWRIFFGQAEPLEISRRDKTRFL